MRDIDQGLIYCAQKNEHRKMRRQLVEFGANPNATQDRHTAHGLISIGMTPLLVAIHWQNIESILVLLEHGADVNLEAKIGNPFSGNYYNPTPLYYAIDKMKLTCIKVLLAHGAEIGDQKVTNSTIIEKASARGFEFIEPLLSHGGNIHYESSRGTIPLMMVRERKLTNEALAYLMDRDDEFDSFLYSDGKTQIQKLENTPFYVFAEEYFRNKKEMALLNGLIAAPCCDSQKTMEF